jgi:2-polyprenyl-6-methoxyphenol hydroxylase-like FAD-dependent oxidoreductase
MTGRMRVLRQFAIAAPADPFDPATLSTSVNRQTFREILATGLHDVIAFGRTGTGFDQNPDGVRLHFADGSHADADVLVAADGTGSPIRRHHLPHARVEDTGFTCVYGRTPLTERTRPLVPAATWDGFTAIVGRSIGMATGVLDFREPPAAYGLDPVEPYWMWALTGRFTPAEPAGLHAAARHAIRRWHPDLRRLVELSTVEETMWIPIRTSVPIPGWPASRVTLLGDAIHAMSPARGSGANTALRDAALLATELDAAARGEKSPVEAIGDYERQMIEYGFAAVRASSEGFR